nr:hypothetical protein [Streptomyces sp. A0592]
MDALATHGRSHTQKYLQAVVFGDELAEFWGDYSCVRATGSEAASWEEAHQQRQAEATTAASEAKSCQAAWFPCGPRRRRQGLLADGHRARDDSR